MTINSLYTSKTKKDENIQEEPSNNKEEEASWWRNASNKTKRHPVQYNSQALDNQFTTPKYKFYYPIREITEEPTTVKTTQPTIKQTEASNFKTRGNLNL